MPLKGFRCPDGEEISIESCLAQCRMYQRCASKATLLAIAQGERKWDGTPHVTSLLNGTMQEYLKAKFPYVTSVEDRAFALLGSTHHKLLEDTDTFPIGANKSTIVSELHFNQGGVQGTIDNLEYEDDKWVLTDYKTWGSFRVARALGVVKIGRGKDAKFEYNEDEKDLHDAEVQLNLYRRGIEAEYKLDISRMQVQITVRDGGLYTATSRGVSRNTYLIQIDPLTDKYLDNFVGIQGTLLTRAIETDTMPPPCSEEERWGDTKCKRYCEVKEHCPHGRYL